MLEIQRGCGPHALGDRYVHHRIAATLNPRMHLARLLRLLPVNACVALPRLLKRVGCLAAHILDEVENPEVLPRLADLLVPPPQLRYLNREGVLEPVWSVEASGCG